MQTGVEGLLHDRTRPSRVPPLPPAIGERVVALTQSDPPGETTHWTAAAMAGLVRISVSSVQRIWRSHGLQPHRVRQFKLSRDPEFVPKLRESHVVGPGSPRRQLRLLDGNLQYHLAHRRAGHGPAGAMQDAFGVIKMEIEHLVGRIEVHFAARRVNRHLGGRFVLVFVNRHILEVSDRGRDEVKFSLRHNQVPNDE